MFSLTLSFPSHADRRCKNQSFRQPRDQQRCDCTQDEVGNSMDIAVVEPVLPIAQPINHQQSAAAPYAATNHHSPPQPAATLPPLPRLPRAVQVADAEDP
ncbi:hypothetical protein GUJ93_ZPchr0001g32540 [Zizania palustris]|uniref:Uncharacterized protein n=1 Tax=Zizania palustris TaxID=103762 RepID=A0A8J5SFC1_ZIZPA|nr:hypothetical protein GUJ93_ZPchr0001g32540 [Zizania palustris]